MNTTALPVDAVQTDTVQDDLRPEYEEPLLKEMLARGVRGKFAGQVPPNPPVVALEPDVAAVFGSAAAVNEALRFLIKVTREPEVTR